MVLNVVLSLGGVGRGTGLFGSFRFLNGGCIYELEDYFVYINSFEMFGKYFLIIFVYYEIKYGEFKVF